MKTTTKTRTKRTGPNAVTGSPYAKKLASILLEAFSGVIGPQDASEAMGLTLPRYYQLETRALQALIESMEPRQRGPQPNPSRELERLETENTRLRKELRRYQTLHRAAQGALGFTSTATEPGAESRSSKKKATRKRRKRSRGERVASALRASSGADDASPASPSRFADSGS